MVAIMDHLHQYTPVHHTTSRIIHPLSSEELEVMSDHFHQILFGGDQLTVAQARGAQLIKRNAKTETGRLLGLVPTVKDWHAKVVFLEVRKKLMKLKLMHF